MASDVVKGSQAAPVLDCSVVADQKDVSPFEHATPPPGITPSPEPRHLQYQTSQLQQQQQQDGKKQRKGTPSLLRRLFCCSASVQEETQTVQQNGSRPPTPSKLPSMKTQTSWTPVFSFKHRLNTLISRTSTEYYDARSELSSQLSQEQLSMSPTPRDQHWIPKTPLVFAPPGLRFVPVPAVTGYAGVWELVPERTDPHPQPIDIVFNASALVRKIHASVPGITIEEDDNFIKMIAQPSFLPKGLPSAVVEPYDKTHRTSPSWMPRRDVKLGHCKGEVFYTSDGMLVLRHESFGLLGKKPDFVIEDYLTLEDNGTIIVDRMCASCYKTKKRAEQIQTVRLVRRPDGTPVC